MNARILLAAAFLTLASGLSAWASCSGHDQQAMSCANGAVWDNDTKTCVPQTSS